MGFRKGTLAQCVEQTLAHSEPTQLALILSSLAVYWNQNPPTAWLIEQQVLSEVFVLLGCSMSLVPHTPVRAKSPSLPASTATVVRDRKL